MTNQAEQERTELERSLIRLFSRALVPRSGGNLITRGLADIERGGGDEFERAWECLHGENWVEAVRWFRIAAEEGDACAQSNLGVMYETGRGVARDNGEAVRWFRLAADQGEAVAQYNLGLMYDTGRGVPQDDDEAVRWYRLAAEQGHAHAQYCLGKMYDTGRGVPQDADEAARWYRQAAEQGDTSA